ncbi:MAG: universal stress protein [Deltaproteobacteria bacterium]|nr:universal stress protein [Deltaproteobacteria bacterium]
MKFEKVLFHTQFGAYAFNSLKTLFELQACGLKEIVLVYVIPKETVGFVPYGGFLKEEEQRIRKQIKCRFESWQKAVEKAGMKCAVRIQTGILNASILKIAENEKVDLIVTGAKKRTLFEKIYVGSHILDILRRSTVPVLMGRYMVQFETEDGVLFRKNSQIFQRPLLATDWSPPSERSLAAITAFRGIAEEAVVVHVIDAKLTKGVNASRMKALDKKSRQRLDAYCARLEKENIATESHLCIGKPVSEILRISRETEATMIIMGRTGKDWMEEYWLGGVSHRVTEISELPVLLVP